MKQLVAKLYVVSLIAALTGCASAPQREGARPATVQSISNAQELGDVVALLDHGDAKPAGKKLGDMVKRDPTDARARELLDSLSVDPIAQLGAKSFDYRVLPGETLQAIAQRFLGDRLKFYLLARYNGIAVPADIQTGQMLRVPGQAPPPPPPPRPRQDTPNPSAPGPAAKAPVPVPAVNRKRAAQIRAAGLAAMTKGQLAQAVRFLQQASSLDPANVAIQRDLGRARRLEDTVRTRRKPS